MGRKTRAGLQFGQAAVKERGERFWEAILLN